MKPSFVIIGLGNPGTSYAQTRHNCGWLALDVLHEACGTARWKETPRFQGIAAEARIVTAPVILLKPTTYMNRSGESVRKIVDFYKLDPAEQILVLSDDADLALGHLRRLMKGCAGTHNGLKSLVACIGEAFPRLRIGIGSPSDQQDLETYVLSVPSAGEREKLAQAMERIPAIVKELFLEGEEAAQRLLAERSAQV